jgi:uncharacterized protein with beta-barrel porin domain
MNRAINHLVLAIVDSFKKFKNKLAYYLAIFAMVFGSTFGTFNAANAADLVLTGNSTNATNGINTDTTLNVAGADTVNVKEFDLVITNVEDSATALIIGAITGEANDDDTPPTLGIVFDEDAPAVAQIVTIASVEFTADNDTAGLIDINAADAAGTSGTINFTGDVDTGLFGTTRGVIDIDFSDSSATAPVLTVNFGGDVSSTLNFNSGAELVVLNVNNATADQAITGVINSDGGAGEGTLNITKTSGTATFASAIGTTEALALIDVTSATTTSVFNGAVEATTIVNTGTATFDSTAIVTTATLDTGSTTTFTGELTATTLSVDGTASATIGYGHLTEASANVIGTVDLSTTATLILADTVTNGMTVFKTTNLDGTTTGGDVATGSKIYLPVNLSNAQTLILFSDTDNGGDVDEATDAAMQNNALMTYDSVEAAQVVTVTATEVAEATVATNLSITKNDAKALSQAYAAAINDTVADATAEDAFGNALNALGGMTATTDTDLALQVAPQTDTISGSAIATRAMTGTVQGIVSNRMASLRSGDAYVTGMSAGNGMSVSSGFIQAFGSEAEQKNTGPTTAKVYGYDSSTSGLAIGFDGMTDNGSTVGLSASFSTTDVDGKGTGKSKNAIDSYTVSVYADKATEKGYIEGSLTYGINDNTSSRLVNTAGLSRTYAGNYDSEQISLKVGGGIPNEVKDGTFVTPFASATGTIISTDSYTETSTTASDALRLKIAQDDINSLVGTVGVKAHMVTDKGTPMISFAINNEFGDTTINSTNTYTGGGTAFNTSTDVEELSATLGLGYSFGNDVSSVNIGYEANANEDDYLSHYGTVKIISKF